MIPEDLNLYVVNVAMAEILLYLLRSLKANSRNLERDVYRLIHVF